MLSEPCSHEAAAVATSCNNLRMNSRTRPASQNVEEVDHVLVLGKGTVVIEINVTAHVTNAAFAPSEHVEEIDHILIFRKQTVVVEVDGVALLTGDGDAEFIDACSGRSAHPPCCTICGSFERIHAHVCELKTIRSGRRRQKKLPASNRYLSVSRDIGIDQGISPNRAERNAESVLGSTELE